jgi:hypothetical protein
LLKDEEYEHVRIKKTWKREGELLLEEAIWEIGQI